MIPIKEEYKISLDFKAKYPAIEPFISYGMTDKEHNGVDIIPKNRIPFSSPIYILSPVNGIVKVRDIWKPPVIGTTKFNEYINKHPLGNLIVIEESNGNLHYMAHMFRMFVFPGQKVVKESPIGLMGCTGKVTAKHLHYAVRDVSGQWIDPKEFIK